ERLADAVLQRAVALLEGELPDHTRAGRDGAPLSAHLLPRAGGECSRLRRPGELHGLPRSRFGDDVGAAERVRQQLIEPHPVEDYGQPHVRAAAAAHTLGYVSLL